MPHIQMFRYGLDADEFKSFLEEKGHTVSFWDTDMTTIDGVSTMRSDDALNFINDLWYEYSLTR